MKIRRLTVSCDDNTIFHFSAYAGDDGSDKYYMRLYVQKNEKVSTDTQYYMEEPPAELINPIVQFVDGLIKED